VLGDLALDPSNRQGSLSSVWTFVIIDPSYFDALEIHYRYEVYHDTDTDALV